MMWSSSKGGAHKQCSPLIIFSTNLRSSEDFTCKKKGGVLLRRIIPSAGLPPDLVGKLHSQVTPLYTECRLFFKILLNFFSPEVHLGVYFSFYISVLGGDVRFSNFGVERIPSMAVLSFLY